MGRVGLGGGPPGPRAGSPPGPPGADRLSSRRVRRLGPRSASRCWRRGGGRASSTWSGPARSIARLNQPVAVEAAAVRTAFSRWYLVGPNVLIRELDADFKFDGDQVVPLKLPGLAAGHDGLDGSDALLAAKCLARAIEHRSRFAAGRRGLWSLRHGNDDARKKSQREDDSLLHLSFIRSCAPKVIVP